MRSFIRNLLVVVGIGLFGWASVAVPADKPKKVVPNKPLATPAELGFIGTTRVELRAAIKRVGLIPAQLPAWLGDRPDAQRPLENEVSRFLTAAGFEVVGSGEFQSAFDRLNRQSGGTHDAATGAIRADVAGVVHQNALRETVANQRLDGYVLISVVSQSAEFWAKSAKWDSVRDPVNHSGAGTLPALSLLVRIVDAQHKVVFARRGGIQLTSYSVPARGSTFPRVPPNELLRDPVRIERAARMATLPLLHSASAIFVGFHNPDINAEKISRDKLPPQPAQHKDKDTPEPLKMPREQILAVVKRVAIVPLDADGRDIPEELRTPLEQMVRRELAPLGWEIVESTGAREALRAKAQEIKPFDPFTGRLDEARMGEIRKSLVRTLGAGRLDAIVWLSIVRTSALQRSGKAEWDGVQQHVSLIGHDVPGRRYVSGTDAGTSGLPASSLQVSITDGNDNVLYESRGGLALLHALKIWPGHGYVASRVDPIDYSDEMFFGFDVSQAAAVHAALRDLTMAPEALAAELDPDPKKKKNKS